MTPVSERRVLLTAVIDRLRVAHEEWAADAELNVLSEDLWERLDECCDVFQDGDLPGDFRRLSAQVDKLRERWEEYKLTVDQNDATVVPDNPFWQALEGVVREQKKTKEQPAARLETIPELTAQGVFDNQICRMYGWVDDEGRPELWRLREERDTPGKHTGPNSGFVPPQEKARLAREERDKAILEATRDKQDRKLSALTKVGSEDIRQLVADGISGSQIAKIKKIKVEDVFRQCDELGIDRPPLHYDDVRTKRSPKEPAINPEAAKAMDVPRSGRKPKAEAKPDPEPKPVRKGGRQANTLPADLQAEILAYQAQGQTAGDIAEVLDDRATLAQVEKVIRDNRAASGSPAHA